MPVAEQSYYPDVGSAIDTKDHYLRRGRDFAMGTTLPQNMGFLFDDFQMSAISSTGDLPVGWKTAVGGTGLFDGELATNDGGTFQLSTGANASSVANISSRATLITHSGTDRWYIATRFKIDTAVNTNAQVGFGWIELGGSNTVMCGFYGGLNASNFIVQYDGSLAGSALDTGTAVDTSFHTWELYCAGDSVVRLLFDGAVIGSATQSSALNGTCCLFGDVRNGGTAAARSMTFDWAMAIFPR